MANQIWEILKEILYRSRDRYAIPPMDGALHPNDALNQFMVVSDSLQKPDDIAIDEAGVLYVSAQNRVIRLAGEGNKDQTVFAEFEAQVGGLNFHSDGRLMVCVDGKGLVLINGEGTRTWIDKSEDRPIKCPTCATTGPDGRLYMTEGSFNHEAKDWAYDLMEKVATGRLIRYDLERGTSEVLLSGLSYPHGLAITRDGRSLLITESWKHRVLSYPFDDIRSATQELVIPNLPGYPARIVPSADGRCYWMSLFGMRTHLVEFVLTEDKFRKEMIKGIKNPEYWLAPSLSSGRDFLEPLQGGAVKQLGIIKPWAPPRSYGLVIKLDEDLDPIKSFHSRPDGKRHGITGLREHHGELYVVSKGDNLILKGTKEMVQ